MTISKSDKLGLIDSKNYVTISKSDKLGLINSNNYVTLCDYIIYLNRIQWEEPWMPWNWEYLRMASD